MLSSIAQKFLGGEYNSSTFNRWNNDLNGHFAAVEMPSAVISNLKQNKYLCDT